MASAPARVAGYIGCTLKCERRISVAASTFRDEQLNLLNSFAEFLKITSDRARTAWLASCQYVQPDVLRKVQLKFLGVLVGRNVGEAGRAICGADSLEGLRRNCDAYGGYGKL